MAHPHPHTHLFGRKFLLLTLALLAVIGTAWVFTRTSGAQGQPQIQPSAIDQMNTLVAMKKALTDSLRPLQDLSLDELVQARFVRLMGYGKFKEARVK